MILFYIVSIALGVTAILNEKKLIEFEQKIKEGVKNVLCNRNYKR